MGEVELAGKDALAAVQRMTSNDAAKLQVGQAQYSALTTAGGHLRGRPARLPPRHAITSCSSSTRRTRRRTSRGSSSRPDGFGDVAVVDTSSRYALIALQGPLAREVLQPLTGADLSDRRSTTGSRTARSPACGRRSRAPGTPGEDGFEIFTPPQQADARLGGAARRPGATPASCPPASARATRCGSRPRCASTATTSTRRRPCSRPTSSGSSAGRRATSTAATALAAQKARGLPRRLVGFEMVDRAIARHGYGVLVDGRDGGQSSRAARRRPS